MAVPLPLFFITACFKKANDDNELECAPVRERRALLVNHKREGKGGEGGGGLHNLGSPSFPLGVQVSTLHSPITLTEQLGRSTNTWSAHVSSQQCQGRASLPPFFVFGIATG